jgi:phosphate transport system protein
MKVRSFFEENLEILQKNLLEMGRIVEEMLNSAILSLKNRDAKLAEETIRKDDIVDKLNLEIENKCLELIALQQPVAKDLRTIASALKIITDIERCGDYTVDIAKVSLKLIEKEIFKPLELIPKMVELVQNMLRRALEGFVERDINKIKKMIEEDDEVDHLYNFLHEELVEYIMKDPSLTSQAIHLLMVGRYLERIADHITNIGERVYYMETGELKELHV